MCEVIPIRDTILQNVVYSQGEMERTTPVRLGSLCPWWNIRPWEGGNSLCSDDKLLKKLRHPDPYLVAWKYRSLGAWGLPTAKQTGCHASYCLQSFIHPYVKKSRVMSLVFTLQQRCRGLQPFCVLQWQRVSDWILALALLECSCSWRIELPRHIGWNMEQRNVNWKGAFHYPIGLVKETLLFIIPNSLKVSRFQLLSLSLVEWLDRNCITCYYLFALVKSLLAGFKPHL